MQIVNSVRLETRRGRLDRPIVIFVDGVQADPGIRFLPMLPAFDDCEVWFFRPTKERYCHASVTNLIGMAMEEEYEDRTFILVGSSMGASNVWNLIQRFAGQFRVKGSLQLFARIERIIMVDPLYDGETEIRTSRRVAQIPDILSRAPGANWLFCWLPAVMVGRDAKTDGEAARAHHKYSRRVSLRRWASEIRASLVVHPTWLPLNLSVPLPPLRILYAKVDEVLTGAGVQRYEAAFKRARFHDADVKCWKVSDTHHVGVAEQPDVWLPAFEWAMAELELQLAHCKKRSRPGFGRGLIISWG
jgi:pimeloyl-ACP methyl ester carboxylesterase